jgi:hypothetical protein
MNPELSSKFTLSDHKTVTVSVKRFHSKSTLCSSPRLHGTKTLLSWQQNGDSDIRHSVVEPEKTVSQNRPIH